MLTKHGYTLPLLRISCVIPPFTGVTFQLKAVHHYSLFKKYFPLINIFSVNEVIKIYVRSMSTNKNWGVFFSKNLGAQTILKNTFLLVTSKLNPFIFKERSSFFYKGVVLKRYFIVLREYSCSKYYVSYVAWDKNEEVSICRCWQH